MELLPRAFDLNHRRDNRCSSGAAPCRLLVAFALAMLASIASPASASARCGAPLSFTYDAPSVARVDVQPFTPAEPRPTQLSGSRDESASPSVEARGTPTTPLTPVVATNTPLKSPVIDPAEVAGKTPAEIDALAKQKGLIPKGPDPAGGRSAYVDPVTGEQRILCHPDGCGGGHVHVNDPSGQRLGINGKPVAPESPEAHLPGKFK